MSSSFFSKNNFKLNEIDSTNKFLYELNKTKHFNEPVVAMADYQTSGRGRNDSSWESKRGENLLLSILFNHELKIAEQFNFSIIISLSIRKLISDYVKEKVYIKWPNDIIVCNKKISGFIIDNIIRKNTVNTSIVGIGMNINQLFFSEFIPPAISLSNLTDKAYDLNNIKDRLLIHIDTYYNNLTNNHLKEFNKHLYLKNKIQPFEVNKKIMKAKILGVNEKGELLVNQNGKKKSYIVNQIKYLL